jgi:hypothetical protein
MFRLREGITEPKLQSNGMVCGGRLKCRKIENQEIGLWLYLFGFTW